MASTSGSDEGMLKYHQELRLMVQLEAEADGSESLLRDAFTGLAIDVLDEAREVDGGNVAYHHAHGVEVSGYNVEDDDTLVLFVTAYEGGQEPGRITKTEADSLFKRVLSFYRKAVAGYHRTLEESSAGFDVAQQIFECNRDFQQIRVILLTDRISAPYDREIDLLEGVEVSYAVWDLTRLWRASTSHRKQESIRIDVEELFGGPIPCLATPLMDGAYKAYLAVLPARLLSDIYDRYRDRLLELNVRSFLQVKGKINQGIRKTINEEPERFLAYNNGITATAESLELCGLPDGGLGIKAIESLQIVNGGQTTASLHYAVKKDHADVSHVAVQAKIIVVPGKEISALVPLVARYSNTQNKVQEADFSANDAFHVELEAISRRTWAPGKDGTNRQSLWFYERARGQYLQFLAQAGTPAKKKALQIDAPTSQKFTKTDLAKYESAWDQYPFLVSLGAQKNFREYAVRLSNSGNRAPDESYYRDVIAKALLFKGAERTIGKLDLGGYRANDVAYTVAYLSHSTQRRLNLDAVWKAQELPESVTLAIEAIAPRIHGVIVRPPGGRNITEWCKKEACWEAVLELRPPKEVISLSNGSASFIEADARTPADVDSQAEIVAIRAIHADTWMRASAWAKETGSLQPWQRGLAYSLGKLAQRGSPPSLKQATQGQRLLAEARRLGFTDSAQ